MCGNLENLYKRNTNSILNARHQNSRERMKQNEREIKALVHAMGSTTPLALAGN